MYSYRCVLYIHRKFYVFPDNPTNMWVTGFAMLLPLRRGFPCRIVILYQYLVRPGLAWDWWHKFSLWTRRTNDRTTTRYIQVCLLSSLKLVRDEEDANHWVLGLAYAPCMDIYTNNRKVTNIFRFLLTRRPLGHVPTPRPGLRISASRHVHTTRVPYTAPPSYRMIAHRFSSSQVDPQTFFHSQASAGR